MHIELKRTRIINISLVKSKVRSNFALYHTGKPDQYNTLLSFEFTNLRKSFKNISNVHTSNVNLTLEVLLETHGELCIILIKSLLILNKIHGNE